MDEGNGSEMRYSTIVEKDDKTLVEIITALEQFEEDRFIAGIQARHYTKYDIDQAIDMVATYQSRMNIEARSLVRFSETFIQQFATDNNKCFETAERYFNRIRSTLCAIKKVFQKTTPRSMVQLLLKWCAVEKSKEKRLYQYFCDNYKGKYKLLVWSAVSKTRKEQRELGITDRGAADYFRQMMENLQKEVAVV